MTNYSHGQAAEEVASKYLQDRGYTVIDRNWRTKWCEIDIIARKDDVVFLVEVKYRQNNNNGAGLDYITPKKQAQMTRAAEGWVQANNWPGDYQLSAISVSGTNFTVDDWIETI